MSLISRGLLPLPLAVALAGCSSRPPTAPDAPRTVIGNVEHYDLEGGFYGILGSDSVTYDPVNLPSEFQRDGLPVVATLRLRPDLMSIHLVGPVVEVLSIQPR